MKKSSKFLAANFLGLACCLSLTLAPAVAAPNVGFITRIEGDVEIYTDPSAASAEGEAPHIKFDEKFYSIKKGKRGFKIKNGFIVKAGDKSKARIVFKNGDQFTVSANSAYSIDWQKEKQSFIVELFFGNVRALIKKDGPRAKTEVRTRSAVMGVRGTDFNVNAWGKTGGTALTVLRGSVEIKQAGATPEQKPVVVPAGSTAKVNAMAKAIKPDDATESKEHKAKIAEQPKIAVAQTTKQDLIIIQHSTKVKKAVLPMNSEGENVTASEEEKEIALLENKAVEATLEDIKTYNPKLYETIKAKHGEGEANRIVDVDEIQAETVRALFIDAPSDPGNTKPVLDDLESFDVY